MNGIPTDLGPYAVLVSLFVLAAIGFTIAVKWLNSYVASKTADLETRVGHLEDQVKALEQGHSAALALIVQAIAMLKPENKDISDKLIEACKALA